MLYILNLYYLLYIKYIVIKKVDFDSVRKMLIKILDKFFKMKFL